MTEQVQTDQFRNISGHLEDLTGGKMVPAGGFVDLTAKEQEDEFNAAKLAESFIRVPSEEEIRVQEAERRENELRAQAAELNIDGYDKMPVNKLEQAVAKARDEQEKEGDG